MGHLTSCLYYCFFFVSQGLPGPPGEKGEVGDVGSMVWTCQGIWKMGGWE